MPLRLDKALVNRGLCESRTKAQHLIGAGVVLVNSKVITQNKYLVHAEDKIILSGNPYPYVSRAGLKLAKAAKVFDIAFNGMTVLDVGASTGGFTDYALRQGARKVFALDVGHDQLHSSLRHNPRVVNMEGVHIRDLINIGLPEKIDIICVDVSFISLQHVFLAIIPFIETDTKVVVLIKPQFESGMRHLKHGVVKDPKRHLEILTQVEEQAIRKGLRIEQATYSPYCGDAGNIEFLAYFKPTSGKDQVKNQVHIEWERIVREAHGCLKQSSWGTLSCC